MQNEIPIELLNLPKMPNEKAFGDRNNPSVWKNNSFEALFSDTVAMKPVAQHLINSVFTDSGDPLYDELSRIQPQFHMPNLDTRGGIGDLFAEGTVQGSTQVLDVEIQISRMAMDGRSVLYAGSLASMFAARGSSTSESADSVPGVVIINIMDFEMGKDCDWHDVLELKPRNPKSRVDNVLRIHNIELPKFRRIAEKDLSNPLQAWLYLIDTAHLQDKTLAEVAKMNEALRDFTAPGTPAGQLVDRYDGLLVSEPFKTSYVSIERNLYRNAIENKRQLEAAVKEAVKEAVEKAASKATIEGEARGKLEAKYATARNALKYGMKAEQVAKIAELPLEDIERIAAELKPSAREVSENSESVKQGKKPLMTRLAKNKQRADDEKVSRLADPQKKKQKLTDFEIE